MSDDPAIPVGVTRCWRVMVESEIDNRVDAIDFLRAAAPSPRLLPAGALDALLDAFPVLPPRTGTARPVAPSRKGIVRGG